MTKLEKGRLLRNVRRQSPEELMRDSLKMEDLPLAEVQKMQEAMSPGYQEQNAPAGPGKGNVFLRDAYVIKLDEEVIGEKLKITMSMKLRSDMNVEHTATLYLDQRDLMRQRTARKAIFSVLITDIPIPE